MQHRQPRRDLFTPRRVEGSPPCKALTPMRVTEGRFAATGQVFKVVDTWTARDTAHRDLGAAWTGRTTFFRRSESSTAPLHQLSYGLIPDTSPSTSVRPLSNPRDLQSLCFLKTPSARATGDVSRFCYGVNRDSWRASIRILTTSRDARAVGGCADTHPEPSYLDHICKPYNKYAPTGPRRPDALTFNIDMFIRRIFP